MTPNHRNTLLGLAAAALLAACGGGGLDESSDSAPTVAEANTAASQAGKVSSQDDARRAANALLPLLRSDESSPTASASTTGTASTGAKSSPWRANKAQGAATAKASVTPKASCSGGGTTVDSTQSGVNVSSPYTSQLFSLTVTTDSSCKQSVSSGGETLTVTSSGVQLSGEVSEDSRRVVYQQIGQSTSSPYREVTEDSYPLNGKTVTDTLLLELAGLAHERYDSNDALSDRQSFFRAQGQASAHDDQGTAFDGAFVIQQGLGSGAGSRFIVGVLDTGAVSSSGTLAIGLVAKPASVVANCGSGTYTVSTPAAISSSDGVLSGTLNITGNGQTASYVFTNDGKVTITAGDGSSQTVSQSVFNDDCAVL